MREGIPRVYPQRSKRDLQRAVGDLGQRSIFPVTVVKGMTCVPQSLEKECFSPTSHVTHTMNIVRVSNLDNTFVSDHIPLTRDLPFGSLDQGADA